MISLAVGNFCPRMGRLLSVLLISVTLFASSKADHPYSHSEVDIPVSLAVGWVTTPLFPVQKKDYDIVIQVEKPFEFTRMQCMMGMSQGEHCAIDDPVLRAQWEVWDDGKVIADGQISESESEKYVRRYIFKVIGRFSGQRERKYTVKVKFTKDGSALDAASPRLIVIQHRYMFNH